MKIIKSLIDIVSQPIKEYKQKKMDKLSSYASMRAVDTVGWWRAHHYRNKKELIEFLSRDMAIKESITPLAMKEAAIPYLLKAAEYHNLAEEEDTPREMEEKYWQLAEESLQEYYSTVQKLKKEYLKDAFVTYVAPPAYMTLVAVSSVFMIKTQNPFISTGLMAQLMYYLPTFLEANHILDRWYMEKPDCPLSNAGRPFLED